MFIWSRGRAGNSNRYLHDLGSGRSLRKIERGITTKQKTKKLVEASSHRRRIILKEILKKSV
jgi:hypothetical protein